MNNYDDIKYFISEISNFLNSIPPYLYSLYATFFAYLISSFLDLNAMSALGNWLEQVGQILLAMDYSANGDAHTPSMPFPECGSMSQGYIGYHLQQTITDELNERKIDKSYIKKMLVLLIFS